MPRVIGMRSYQCNDLCNMRIQYQTMDHWGHHDSSAKRGLNPPMAPWIKWTHGGHLEGSKKEKGPTNASLHWQIALHCDVAKPHQIGKGGFVKISSFQKRGFVLPPASCFTHQTFLNLGLSENSASPSPSVYHDFPCLGLFA